MMRLRQIAAKSRSARITRKSEQSLRKEIAAHLAMLEEDLRRQGLDPGDANLAARWAFGGLEQAKEQYREQRGFVWLDQLWQDLRRGVRSLRKSPGFLSRCFRLRSASV